MTIRGTHFDVFSNEFRHNMVDCIWFERNNNEKEEIHYCTFNADELIKVEDISNEIYT